MARDAKAPTGASVLVSSHERNAAGFTFRGANTLLEAADLQRRGLRRRPRLRIQSLQQVRRLLPADHRQGQGQRRAARGQSRRAAAFCARRGIPRLPAAGRHPRHQPQEADVLVTSLVGKFGEGGQTLALEPGEQPPALVARGLAGGGYEMSLPAFLGALRELGTKYIVLTDSRSGAFVCADGEILFCPALEVEVAGTAGAGDAFAATFAAYLALGRSRAVALKAATINAASVIAHVDTQTGLMPREAIEERLSAVRVSRCENGHFERLCSAHCPFHDASASE